MPTYLLTSPEGRKYRVTGNGTGQEALAQLQAKLGASAPTATPAVPAPRPQEGLGRTALEQGLQGATFATADEGTDFIGALYAKYAPEIIGGRPDLFADKSVGDIYNEARGESQQRMRRQFEDNPVTSIGANIGGALLTGGAAATTKAGAATGNLLRTGGTLARIGKGAAAGALSGAAYGAGTAEDNRRLEGAKQGAIFGGVVGGAIPAAGAVANSAYKGTKTALRGTVARGADELGDIASGMKYAAGSVREKMRKVGAVIAPQKTQQLSKNLDDALSGIDLIPELTPKTSAIVARIKEAANDGIELNKLDQYRRLLRAAGNEDTVAASAVRKAIDDTVNNLDAKDFAQGGKQAVTLLNQFRKEYTQAAKFDDIADILIKADGDPNKIKSGLTRFMNNKDNWKGFSPAEVDALRSAARGSTFEKLYKMGGKFGFDLGNSLNFGNTALPVVGGYVNPLIPASGTASRQMQKYLARGKAENLLRTIENPAAVGKSITPITPLGSLPGGAVAGSIAGAETTPARITQPKMGGQNAPAIPNAPAAPPAMQPPQSSLFQKVIQQESGGKQFDKSGKPLASSKGAIGIAQVMPKTAKEAAKLAGLPYSEKRYRTDPAYNAAIGEAYLNKQLQDFGGDEALALMAYNWGPTAVKGWLKRGARINEVPLETRKYVASILGGGQ